MTINFPLTYNDIDLIRGALTGSVVNWEARGHFDMATDAKDLLRRLDGVPQGADPLAGHRAAILSEEVREDC